MPNEIGVFPFLCAETGGPIPGAIVALKGEYTEEKLGTRGDQVGIPYQPQFKEMANGNVALSLSAAMSIC